MMLDRAHEAAAILLRIGAVAINTQQLFTYTSGIKSPIYTDNRLLISYPEERHRITKMMVSAAEESVGLENIEVVAGTATAGIPFAAWLAHRLLRPMVYVRGAAKEHGRGRQIEGRLEPGQRVAVVEDLITTGGSSLATAEVLARNGAIVTCCLAIFSYELEKAARGFEQRGIQLVPLTTLGTLLEVAVRENYIQPADVQSVLTWSQSLERG
jgi:orotate phosphoribosyltransferase